MARSVNIAKPSSASQSQGFSEHPRQKRDEYARDINLSLAHTIANTGSELAKRQWGSVLRHYDSNLNRRASDLLLCLDINQKSEAIQRKCREAERRFLEADAKAPDPAQPSTISNAQTVLSPISQTRLNTTRTANTNAQILKAAFSHTHCHLASVFSSSSTTS